MKGYISRRHLFLAAAAARLVAGTEIEPADPLTDQVRAWVAERDAADELQAQWGQLERTLNVRRGAMSLTAATRSGFPEARKMRALMRQIRAADRKLDRMTARLVAARPRSAEGALSKIEMGLRIQQPLDSEEYSWALIKSGYDALRHFI